MPPKDEAAGAARREAPETPRPTPRGRGEAHPARWRLDPLPIRGAPHPGGRATAGPAQTRDQAAASAQPQPLVNLNTANAAELEKLPGVGPAMAARILEYRQKNGSFKKIEERMNVKGIGEKTFLKLKPLITVTPPKSNA